MATTLVTTYGAYLVRSNDSGFTLTYLLTFFRKQKMLTR